MNVKWKQFLQESEAERQYQIFCDMDIVLVDFVSGILNYLNKKIRFILANKAKIQRENPEMYQHADKMLEELQQETVATATVAPDIKLSDLWTSGSGADAPNREATRAFMYHCVANNYNFWSELEWLPEGKELWNFIKDFHPIILSGPMGNRSKLAKADWVKKNLGFDIPLITTHKKYEYANYKGKQGILIDDLRKYLDAWEQNGGIGIWKSPNTSAGEIIEKLKQFGFGQTNYAIGE